MNICIVTPAPARSRHGNRVTARRWARFLRELGHRVRVEQTYNGWCCDLLIALHAQRSHPSIVEVARRRPGASIIVALTGTDVYGARLDATFCDSVDRARRLVVLQAAALDRLPERLHAKVRVIHQSVVRPIRRARPRDGVYEVCVLGHLREVKDPFRAALAARCLPEASRVQILHAGAAMTSEMRRLARAEERVNPRYRWLGELPRWRALRVLGRSRLMILSSRAEGGANVISEAIGSGVPILASRIAGTMGILGSDYPGYFPVKGTRALAALLERAETDRRFYRSLEVWCQRLAPLVDPRRERAQWAELLEEMATGR